MERKARRELKKAQQKEEKKARKVHNGRPGEEAVIENKPRPAGYDVRSGAQEQGVNFGAQQHRNL